MKVNEKRFYNKTKNWDFSMFEIESIKLTNWDLYELLNKITTKESKILDLGTGGGEKLLKLFPECAEILGTDYSSEMIKTANNNLKKSGRKNISFRIMDNLKMEIPDNYFDVVVARNTITDPAQIIKCLKPGGYLLIRGVDKYDCYSLKLVFGTAEQEAKKPISIIDYENVINAGFKDVELIPIHEREYFKNKYLLKEFLKKVPILDELCEEGTNYNSQEIDDKLLDEYIKENTEDGRIRLFRRYYGIIAKKPE